MKITFISNACCIYESGDYKLLTDPWLVDGVFEGAWFHAPALKTSPQDLVGVDALYISHIHPDHYDLNTLKFFPFDIAIFVLDHPPNFLLNNLKNLGFTNIIPIKPETNYSFGPFELTLFQPFEKHVYHEAQIGNLIDSSILVRADGCSIFNANDNVLSVEAAQALHARYGNLTLAQLNYNAAGPFPSCFNHFNEAEKLEKHGLVLKRNLAHMLKIAEILQADYTMPFAGAYVIGGKFWQKNQYLGTTSWDEAATYIQENGNGQTRPLVLQEGLTFDLKTHQITNGTYQPVDTQAQWAYITQVLADKKYPYELDATLNQFSNEALSSLLKSFLPYARMNLWKAQARFDHYNTWTIAIRLTDCVFQFRFDQPGFQFLLNDQALQEPYLLCDMDIRLLAQILQRKAHWNSAEIGCHIDFIRQPDQYLPDIHTLMSFFNLPPKKIEAFNALLESTVQDENLVLEYS
ncbi:MBL fold metallo-hydrolase [Vampirovibrio sp.]|uniref:MBL fold metallo-hydrolase n=1 Tax=Vampirovibrio sp. TaxID=2717857 RepID=UPI0035948A06